MVRAGSDRPFETGRCEFDRIEPFFDRLKIAGDVEEEDLSCVERGRVLAEARTRIRVAKAPKALNRDVVRAGREC